jgi:hypothetical protein
MLTLESRSNNEVVYIPIYQYYETRIRVVSQKDISSFFNKTNTKLSRIHIETNELLSIFDVDHLFDNISSQKSHEWFLLGSCKIKPKLTILQTIELTGKLHRNSNLALVDSFPVEETIEKVV